MGLALPDPEAAWAGRCPYDSLPLAAAQGKLVVDEVVRVTEEPWAQVLTLPLMLMLILLPLMLVLLPRLQSQVQLRLSAPLATAALSRTLAWRTLTAPWEASA